MDMSKYRGMFLNETREHLQSMGKLLISLEKDPSARKDIDALFRNAHSIKGMAASMGYGRTADLAHSLEDMLDGFRSSGMVPPEAVDRLLAGIDLLEKLVDDIAAERPEREITPFFAPEPVQATELPTLSPPVSGRDEGHRSIRVNTELLDRFINLTGGLITNRYTLQAACRESRWQEVREGLEQLARLVTDLHHHVLKVRMMPLESITGRLPRMVRDLSRKNGKKISLRIEGEDVELDRAILEALSDPLMHMIRNAVDHGIERSGEIRVKAWREKDMVLLEVADNGRGIDAAVIRQKAVERGFLSQEQAKSMRNRDLLQLICRPGFSTASQVTDTSGRGVGMDVVKSAVENFGGVLEIASLPGRGTRLRLKLPLSIAIIQVLLVEVHGHTLGIPITKVLRTLVIRGGDIRAVGRQLTVAIEDVGEEGEKVETSVPLLSLRKILRLPARAHPGSIPLILTEARGRRVGLVVDRFIGQREVFVKSLGFPLDSLSGITGATVLGDGRVIFLIDPHGLLEDPFPAAPSPITGERL